MTGKSLGQLPNAPLAYVLGAVKFDPYLALEKHISALQERLQSDFPRFQPMHEVGINIAGGIQTSSESKIRYEFASADNQHGIILNRETLVFHATAYTTYEDFGERLGTVLEHVGAELKHLFVRRIGLRYIDILIPKKGDSLDDYVCPGLRCLPPLSLPSKARGGLAIAEFRLEEGTLAVRYAIGTGQPTLPPDIQPLSLMPPALLQRTVSENTAIGILDFDRFVTREVPFNAANIKEQFDHLHKDESVAFHEVTTDHAKKIWSRRTTL